MREIKKLKRLIEKQQAKDNGLWFAAQTAAEAYLQHELRKLHSAVEKAIKEIGVK